MSAGEIAPLPRRVKVLYGVGSVAIGAKSTMLGMLLFYYSQVVGLRPDLVGLALGISLFVDAFWDPLIGQFSDNLRTRWGRRHPLMYASAIPISISFWALFNPPDGLSDMQLFSYLLALILTVRLFTSFYEVPSTALAPELAPDYHDRTVVLSYRWLFGALGTGVCSVLAYGWFFRATPEYPIGQLNPAGYGPLSLTIAVLLLVAILVSAIGTHHRIPQFHQPKVRNPTLAETLREVGATLKNWNFGVSVTAGLIFGMSIGLYSGLALYFATYFWELPASNVLVLAIAQLISAPIAASVGPLLSRRWGKRRACMTMFFAGVMVTALPILLRLIGFFPENGSPWLVPILTADRLISGVLNTGGFIVVSSMIADITEESQLKTGRRSEGLLQSADSLLQKSVSGLSTLLPGLILAFIDFPTKAAPGTVPEATLHALGWIYLPATVTLSVLSITTWSFYRIDQAQHERNLAGVREATAAAEQRIEATEVAPDRAPT